jgi:hypothetical protein
MTTPLKTDCSQSSPGTNLLVFDLQREVIERIFWCGGSNQHFRKGCLKRLAKEARDLRAAEISIASVTPVVPATTQPAEN